MAKGPCRYHMRVCTMSIWCGEQGGAGVNGRGISAGIECARGAQSRRSDTTGSQSASTVTAGVGYAGNGGHRPRAAAVDEAQPAEDTPHHASLLVPPHLRAGPLALHSHITNVHHHHAGQVAREPRASRQQQTAAAPARPCWAGLCLLGGSVPARTPAASCGSWPPWL